ncbi:MAG: biotin/lipoyl-containing protein [Elusimicrobiota bacterium]
MSHGGTRASTPGSPPPRIRCWNTGKSPSPGLSSDWGFPIIRRTPPLVEAGRPIRKVSIPLKQHLGQPAEPVVSVGEKVAKGRLIADLPADKLGAPIHASIGGVIQSVDSAVTIQG